MLHALPRLTPCAGDSFAAGREREAREPGLAYLLVELVPDSAGEPWGAADDAANNIGAAVPIVPFTPCDPEEHAEQVLPCSAGIALPMSTCMIDDRPAAFGGSDGRGCCVAGSFC